jgi:serine/threonine protein kinase
MSTVSNLHAQEIAHRDLKPENIVVIRNTDGLANLDAARIIDFGHARFLDPRSVVLPFTTEIGKRGNLVHGTSFPAFSSPCDILTLL